MLSTVQKISSNNLSKLTLQSVFYYLLEGRVIVYVITLPPLGVQSSAMSVSLCLYVYLSTLICQKGYVRISQNFLYMLTVLWPRVLDQLRGLMAWLRA